MPLLLLLAPALARAGECGSPSPDYVAERAVTVAGATFRTTVHVSGDRQREDADIDGHKRVTIRGSSGTVVFDPDTREGTVLPVAHGPPAGTRRLDSVQPTGERSRVVQFRRDGRWIDLSHITCRADGIMTRMDFVSLDRTGREVHGSVVQSRIRVGAVGEDAFKVPPDVRIHSP